MVASSSRTASSWFAGSGADVQSPLLQRKWPSMVWRFPLLFLTYGTPAIGQSQSLTT